MRKSFILLFFILCYFLNSNSQELKIVRVSLQPMDLSASQHPCFDNEGDTCALIKLKTDHVEGIQFSNPNQYVKFEYEDGVYSVYVPVGSGRKLFFQHKDYLPVQLDMADYGYRKLKKGKTYLVVIETPKIHELKSTVVLKVEPQNSNVIFDGTNYSANSFGTFEIPVIEGRHTYTVTSENYKSQSNIINIGKTEVKTLSVRLQPIMHDVIIGCNVKNSRIYVDNIDYGSPGQLKIPQGKHNIRVQADGYVDSEQNVEISATTGHLSFILNENKIVTHIHATSVTINASDTPCIFINNKKVKGWRSGVPIMLMPGRYIVTAFDRGREREIVVGTEPITINL